MSSFKKYFLIYPSILIALLLVPSCDKFLDPEQELGITEDQLFNDWYEYRSVEMGLYGLQQKLVEQLVVMGELRGDLLTITPNADADMVEIYNFDVSKTNKYASPTNFFKLISASNNFIRVLKKKHPEVLNKSSLVSNFDRLYGEALCMRAWAYFNAVRIYGKVPFIHESLSTIEEIENYINSPGSYVDSVNIAFTPDGYYNDTLFNSVTTLEKMYFDVDMVLDYFTNQLENEVKAVGVDHAINNNDQTWEVTIWNTYSMHALLGSMYLEQGNLTKAEDHFNKIITNSTENLRYQLDNSFSYGSWSNIFSSIDSREHIYTIWFNKTNFQQNELQSFFEPFYMDKYMLKPTAFAISNWESTWRNQSYDYDLVNPSKTEMRFAGIPSDFYRGYGVSYLYLKNGGALTAQEYMNMLFLRADGDTRGANAIMDGVDTIVWKYSINKDRYDMDANFIVYRAASIHLYMAEIYSYWVYEKAGVPYTYPLFALTFLNDGSNYDINDSRLQMGVRGRVGLSNGEDAINVTNIIYTHDPFTNEITGFVNLTGNLPAKIQYMEDQIMNERARELAFEGERFYDLIRVAKRRNDPSYLASKVSAKYGAGKSDEIYNKLMDPQNWYIKYFEE